VKELVREHLLKLMDVHIMGNGKMVNKMVKEFLQ